MPRLKALDRPVYKAWETSLCALSSEKQKRPTLKPERMERTGWHEPFSKLVLNLRSW